MPEVAAKVMNLAEGGHDISFTELERIIKADSGLTARILKIANSALYARQREIKSLQMAITLLGFKNIKILVLLVTASNLFPQLRKSGFHEAYWKHSILSAFFSKKLAVKCGRSDIAEEAFIAGLLHDIGQVVLACSSPEQYRQALEAERLGALLLETIEEQMFDANHRDVGGALLKKWNFPELYADVALEHETINIGSPHKTLVILVSVSSILSEKFTQSGIARSEAGDPWRAPAPYVPDPRADRRFYFRLRCGAGPGRPVPGVQAAFQHRLRSPGRAR